METFIEKDKRKTNFTGKRPGNMWYPKVRLRSAHPLDKKRAKITPKEVDEWFGNFKKFIQDVGVPDHPGQIWNCDEKGFDLQGRTALQSHNWNKGTYNRVALFHFNCAMHPSIMLFPRKHIPNQCNVLEGGVPGSCYSLTEKGYMDTVTFYVWLDKHFIPNLPPARPLVLFVDSAGAHIDLDTFQLANRNDVFI